MKSRSDSSSGGVNDVLVAHHLAARGLDLEHITHVINFDPPADEKDYLQLVGRTARADRTGTGITKEKGPLPGTSPRRGLGMRIDLPRRVNG